jgi:RecB family exonuclease
MCGSQHLRFRKKTLLGDESFGIENGNMFSYLKPIQIKLPQTKPSPPFGPSSLEIMRSCALRSCFDATQGYERRLGFPARIGTAFHKTLQSIYDYPFPKTSLDETISEARDRFKKFLNEQIRESENHPREVGLPRDKNRIHRAADAIVAEAISYYKEGDRQVRYREYGNQKLQNQEDGVHSQEQLIEVETSVQTDDGLFRGRIDRIEHHSDGAILFDYKSVLRNDVPERYERQIQLYAYLYKESRKEWPQKAYVNYPLTSTKNEIKIDPDLCLKVANDSQQIIQKLQSEKNAYQLAAPGEVCQVCDYRPWCKAFWDWQDSEDNLTIALEKAYWGVKGEIISIEKIDYHTQLVLDWYNAKIKLISPQERFPQLDNAHPGLEISILEANLKGLRHQPKAIISPRTELFLYI